jgi:hypothetical protein
VASSSQTTGFRVVEALFSRNQRCKKRVFSRGFMKTPHLLFALLGALTLNSGLAGQVVSSISGTDDHAQRFRQDHASALAAARGRMHGEVVPTLARTLRTKPDSAEWHLAIAQRLMHVARDLAAEAQLEAAREVTALAGQRLEALAASDARPAVRARALVMRGEIAERFAGDRAAALRYYEAAQALHPHARDAAEKAERLKSAIAAASSGGIVQ